MLVGYVLPLPNYNYYPIPVGGWKWVLRYYGALPVDASISSYLGEAHEPELHPVNYNPSIRWERSLRRPRGGFVRNENRCDYRLANSNSDYEYTRIFCFGFSLSHCAQSVCFSQRHATQTT